MSLYEKALSIATRAHRGQVDKAGVDYIHHPLFVASLVSSDEEKATALLHDVLEDSSFTIDDLRDEGISDNVVEAVSVLTKPKGKPYFDYLKGVKKNNIARQVKLADLQHNSDLTRLAKVTDEDLKRREKYQKAIKYLQ